MTLSFDFGGRRTEVRFVESIGSAAVSTLLGGEPLAVFDATTRRLFGAGWQRCVVLRRGERAKRWASVRAILSSCAASAMGRDGWLLGVGGGVVCDVSALAASLYMRGCRLALAPTTLLAMVDAALGGKTGINFWGWKNLVGTFYPAALVLVELSVLATLPPREYRSGLAEAIKTAIIGDAGLLDLIERRRQAVLARDPEVLADIVGRCIAVKGAVAAADPREEGGRAVLNLGHTFAHALESFARFRGWTHGEAVAWGIDRSLALGVHLGVTDGAFARRIRQLLASCGYRLEAPVGWGDLAHAAARDKKRRGGRLRFVVARAPGVVTVEEPGEEAIRAALGPGGGKDDPG